MSTPGNNESQSGNQSFGWESYSTGTPSDQEFQYAPPTPMSSPRISTSEVRNTGKGFFGALFDANFDNFISVKFAKVIYIIALIFSGLFVFFAWVLPALAALMNGSFGIFMAILVFGWIPAGAIALVQLVTTRLFLEFVVALVKTSENTSKIAENTRG